MDADNKATVDLREDYISMMLMFYHTKFEDSILDGPTVAPAPPMLNTY
jgi:hypothetical protein